jgi:DnaJ family protein C protein 22
MYDDFVKAFDPTGEQNALKVLNLTQSATQEEIKKSYKKLAREWHPDKYRGDKETAQSRFMEIQEAYEILSTIKAKRASKNQKKRDDYNKKFNQR